VGVGTLVRRPKPAGPLDQVTGRGRNRQTITNGAGTRPLWPRPGGTFFLHSRCTGSGAGRTLDPAAAGPVVPRLVPRGPQRRAAPCTPPPQLCPQPPPMTWPDTRETVGGRR
jgi:hypothetical protein